MAKNVVKKKQRIAHNKTCDEDHEMLSEGNDLLYGIFQEMKKNNDLSAIHFTSFETNLSETSKTFTQQKIQNNAIPTQNHTCVSKSKAFGPSRKFPLMEKCARDLKQIKHNRQMPKPRAHLSVLLKSPTPKAHLGLLNSLKPKNAEHIPLSNSLKPKEAQRIPLSNSSSFNNLVPDAKSKKTVIGKDKKNSCNSQNRKLTEVLEHDRVPAYETKVKKNFAKQPKDEEIPSKNCQSIMKKNSVEENSHLNSNNLDQTGDNSSGSDEYETFIKKVCPKKSKNKKDSSKKPQKSTTKLIKKHISKPISSESDSDPSDDETPVPSKTNNKNCKKFKKNHEITDNRQSTTSKKDVASKSKKVRKKRNSRTVSKSVSSENDSDINDESSKLCYATRSKRLKSHEVLDNRQSKDDSESEMDIVNDETYHDSSSESGDLPSISDLQSNSYTCGSQSSEQSNAHISVLECNSLSPNTSVNSSLVFSNQLNEAISSKTSDISSAVSNNNAYISNKTSGIASLSPNALKPVLQNEAPDTALSVGSAQKNIPYKTSVIPSLVSSAQQNSPCKTSGTASLVNDDPPNVLHKMSVSSFVGSNKLNECLAAKTGSLLNNSKEDDFSKSTIVDLTESDNECENSFSIMPKIIMTSGQIPNESELHSEESDIELLDVIVTELPEKSKTNCSSKNMGSSCSNDSTNKLIVKTEKIDQTLTCSNARSQNTSQLQTPLNGKYEVAYSTGICQDYDKKVESRDKAISQFNLSNDEFKNSIVTNAVNTLISSKEVKKEPPDDCEIVFDIASTNNSNQNFPGAQTCNNANIKAERDSKCFKGVSSNGVANSGCITNEQSNQSSIVSNTENSPILSKNIKKEACDDDCEIVLDIATSSIPNQKLPSVQICNNRNIKIERDSKVAKQVTPVHIAGGGSITTERKNKLSQKLHEVACSNFRNLNSSHNKNSELLGKEIDLDTMNIKALLQDLKKEFATYQDILHTEQSVENTFKLLERCQAEKLVSLKSKITRCLEVVPGIGDCNSIKNAVDKLLDSSELSSSSSLKDCSQVPTICHNISSVSDISVQDLKTFATMNLVPLSSIPENDIKPNLSELKCALKQEANTSELKCALKQEANTSCEINSMSSGEKCVVCAKDASAACLQCAKVFFCSNICGRKYWEGGHKNACAK